MKHDHDPPQQLAVAAHPALGPEQVTQREEIRPISMRMTGVRRSRSCVFVIVSWSASPGRSSRPGRNSANTKTTSNSTMPPIRAPISVAVRRTQQAQEDERDAFEHEQPSADPVRPIPRQVAGQRPRRPDPDHVVRADLGQVVADHDEQERRSPTRTTSVMSKVAAERRGDRRRGRPPPAAGRPRPRSPRRPSGLLDVGAPRLDDRDRPEDGRDAGDDERQEEEPEGLGRVAVGLAVEAPMDRGSGRRPGAGATPRR